MKHYQYVVGITVVVTLLQLVENPFKIHKWDVGATLRRLKTTTDKTANLHEVESLKDLNNKKNKAERKGQLVVIYFFTSWCEPCKNIASPALSGYATDYPKTMFLKVNTGTRKDIKKHYSVRSVPTFKFIKKGTNLDDVVGADMEEVKSMLDQYGK
ncbi:thioredoxin 1-like [Macrosteles quadrilineatus]|uniref:thioredoxin 1-like n=1 Tax=Macrosteles quadrilineatus TaxID=74068 RepID=UPI0023E22AA9|nr:thioredoxin 1-like [Macrosteles quadrilineatus]